MSGLSPSALRVRNLRRTATRMSVSIGVAVLVMATVVPVSTASASASDVPRPDRTALVLGGTTIPTPDKAYLDAVRDLFVGPTHPGDITYVAVTTPEEVWPATGIARVLLFVAGPQSLVGFDGPVWPDEPLWKLSGIFDLTFDQSVQQGIANLEDAIAAHPNEHLVIFGYSQGAMIANIEKQKLADQYPNGDGPDIEFVLIGDENLPNGGLAARFPGLYVPIIDLTLNGPAPTDTQFHTTEFVRQYDGFADFPLYPINLAADANAVLGFVYVHSRYLDPGPGEPPPIHTTTGDTDYYFYPTDNLPLFGPLRTIGVPEPVIDVVEPVAKVLVEQGYDRNIPLGEPTPARLIPPINPVKLTGDLVDAVGEGANNATKLTPKSLTDGFKFTPLKPSSSKGDNQTGRPIGAGQRQRQRLAAAGR